MGEGELRDKLEEKIASYGLSNDVRIESFRKDLNKCYSALDLFAFPSIYEGLGMVAVEAQVNGLNAIASARVPSEANIGLLALHRLDKRLFLQEKRRANLGIDASAFDIKKSAPILMNDYVVLGEKR